MPRIHFNISSALFKWRHRGPVCSRRFRIMDLQALEDMPLGPGWFDSSFDLGHGLEVEVALPGDPPFQAWLDSQLRALQPVAARPAPAVPAEQMLEFEPVDWKAWAPPDLVAVPLPARESHEMDLPEADLPDLELPNLELPSFELPGPKLELKLARKEHERELELELV